MTATSEISMVWSMIDAWCTVTGTLCQQILQAHFNWARDLPGVAGLISNTSGWISSVLYVESWKWMKNDDYSISECLEYLETSRTSWNHKITGHVKAMGYTWAQRLNGTPPVSAVFRSCLATELLICDLLSWLRGTRYLLCYLAI